jgi:hypothetical protein
MSCGYQSISAYFTNAVHVVGHNDIFLSADFDGADLGAFLPSGHQIEQCRQKAQSIDDILVPAQMMSQVVPP